MASSLSADRVMLDGTTAPWIDAIPLIRRYAGFGHENAEKGASDARNARGAAGVAEADAGRGQGHCAVTASGTGCLARKAGTQRRSEVGLGRCVPLLCPPGEGSIGEPAKAAVDPQ